MRDERTNSEDRGTQPMEAGGWVSQIATIACFRGNFGFHFQAPIFTNSVLISPLTTHCVCFSCHQVLSHQDPIWRGTRFKTRKDARPPICRSCSFSSIPKWLKTQDLQASKMLADLKTCGRVELSGSLSKDRVPPRFQAERGFQFFKLNEQWTHSAAKETKTMRHLLLGLNFQVDRRFQLEQTHMGEFPDFAQATPSLH